MSYRGPKAKKSRRLGVAITPKSQRYLETRPQPPGQHGRGRRPSKLSDYGRQLMEKQRIRFQYNMSEKQLRLAYEKAARSQDPTPEVLIQLLESRLDTVVLRAGFARSIFAARQYVNHGHFLVNGKKVDIPSYHVKVGDVITTREKSKNLDCFKSALAVSTKTPYVAVDEAEMSARLTYVPGREEIPVIGDVATVVEFYSR
ncbi:MAG: 30S ribosomal protein S4 [Verrucomicrobia bacterium]|nr:30S ribosomal protein S4 [Verrucomicrobiota bacterium]MCH8511630.1 30S ribosomal protein S4 [Kiritimatiellia bacterium]